MGFPRYVSFFSELDAVEILPRRMMEALGKSGVEVDSRLKEVDEGWSFNFRYSDVSYTFTSCYKTQSEPLECMGWVKRDVGYWASLFGPRETYIYPEIESIIQAALVGLSTVQEVKWISDDQ